MFFTQLSQVNNEGKNGSKLAAACSSMLPTRSLS